MIVLVIVLLVILLYLASKTDKPVAYMVKSSFHIGVVFVGYYALKALGLSPIVALGLVMFADLVGFRAVRKMLKKETTRQRVYRKAMRRTEDYHDPRRFDR